MTGTTSPVIVAGHLTKQFGRAVVVDDVSFSVPAGQIVGFLGPNGAGKTTTIGMLLGLLRPTRGRVEILGLFMDTYGPEQLPTLNICYLAKVSGGEPRASSDASDLAWFRLDELPDEIAFSWEKEALALLASRSGG